jgi:hypothetical protein
VTGTEIPTSTPTLTETPFTNPTASQTATATLSSTETVAATAFPSAIPTLLPIFPLETPTPSLTPSGTPFAPQPEWTLEATAEATAEATDESPYTFDTLAPSPLESDYLVPQARPWNYATTVHDQLSVNSASFALGSGDSVAAAMVDDSCLVVSFDGTFMGSPTDRAEIQIRANVPLPNPAGTSKVTVSISERPLGCNDSGWMEIYTNRFHYSWITPEGVYEWHDGGWFEPRTRYIKIVTHRPVLIDAIAVYDNMTRDIRINAGGPTVTAGGKTWNQDVYFSGGQAGFYDTNVNGTNSADLFDTYRVATTDNGTFTYSIPMPTPAIVRLYFAETYFTGQPGRGANGPGKRIFTVSIEGTPVAVNLDLNATAGPLNAYVVELQVPPGSDGNGRVDISFVASVNRPLVNAIELFSAAYLQVQVPTPTPTPSPTAVNEDVDFTNIRFFTDHAELQSLMFWAIFNETSEDRFFSGMDAVPTSGQFPLMTREQQSQNVASFLVGSNFCTSSGQPVSVPNETVNWNATVTAVVHCHDHRYLETQLLINALINYERSPNTDYIVSNPDHFMGAFYGYFFRNFGGTFGETVANNLLWNGLPACGQAGLLRNYSNIAGQQGLTAVSVDEANVYFIQDFPTLIEYLVIISGAQRQRAERQQQLEDKEEANTLTPDERLELESIRNRTDAFSTLICSYPDRRILETTAVHWSHDYLQCKLQSSSSSYLNQRIQLAHWRIMPIMTDAINDFYSEEDDPTNASFSLRAANRANEAIFRYIGHTGNLPALQINNVTPQVTLSYYDDAQQQAGQPCGSAAQVMAYWTVSTTVDQFIDQLRVCYEPQRATLLQPVVLLEVVNGQFLAYTWLAISYQQSANQLHANRYESICTFRSDVCGS